MIKQGGYALGHDYRWYRDMGHGPIGAAWMRLPTAWAIVMAIVAGILLAWSLP